MVKANKVAWFTFIDGSFIRKLIVVIALLFGTYISTQYVPGLVYKIKLVFYRGETVGYLEYVKSVQISKRTRLNTKYNEEHIEITYWYNVGGRKYSTTQIIATNQIPINSNRRFSDTLKVKYDIDQPENSLLDWE